MKPIENIPLQYKDAESLDIYNIRWMIKWIFDLLFASIFMIISLPLIVIIAIIIRLDSPGEIFYFHERIGFQGKKFKLLKFRTMYKNADKIINNLYSRRPDLKDDVRPQT